MDTRFGRKNLELPAQIGSLNLAYFHDKPRADWSGDTLPALIKVTWSDEKGVPSAPLILYPGQTEAQKLIYAEQIIPQENE